MRRTTAALLLLALASPTTASPIVDPYVAQTSGVFTGNPVGGLAGLGTSQIVFGEGVGQSPPSSITFTGVSLPAGTSGVMEIGQIAFFNGVISSTSLTPNPFNFGLQLTLALANRPHGILTETIPLESFASLNIARQPFQSADTLTILPGGLPTFSFFHGGWEYTVQVLGFGAASGDGFGTNTKLTVFEWDFGGGLLTAPLMAQVTASPVASAGAEPLHHPEPTTLAVLGLMTLGGGMYVRRRRVPA